MPIVQIDSNPKIIARPNTDLSSLDFSTAETEVFFRVHTLLQNSDLRFPRRTINKSVGLNFILPTGAYLSMWSNKPFELEVPEPAVVIAPNDSALSPWVIDSSSPDISVVNGLTVGDTNLASVRGRSETVIDSTSTDVVTLDLVGYDAPIGVNGFTLGFKDATQPITGSVAFTQSFWIREDNGSQTVTLPTYGGAGAPPIYPVNPTDKLSLRATGNSLEFLINDALTHTLTDDQFAAIMPPTYYALAMFDTAGDPSFDIRLEVVQRGR